MKHLAVALFVVLSMSAEAIAPATAETPVLRAWQDMKYGMFIHYGLSTFVVDQFGKLPATSKDYAPTGLDTDQWMRVARDAGMKYAVLTVKHHYGHALWPSKVSDFTVATSSAPDTDVVRAFVDSARKYGIKPGFYYSLGWDAHHMRDGKMTPEEYEKFMLAQMTELFTDYGPITELWCDIPWDLGPDTKGVLVRLYAHVKALQPDCLVVHNQGFVDGSYVETRDVTYYGKAVDASPIAIWPKDVNNGELVPPPETGHDPRVEHEGTTYYLPNEVCNPLGQRRWFWGANDHVRPLRQVYEMYRRSVGRNSNLLLNVGPDKQGRVPDEQVVRLTQLAELIRHPERVEDSVLIDCTATASNVFQGKDEQWGPQCAIDMDAEVTTGTRWATDTSEKTAWLEVDLGGRKTFSHGTLCDFEDRVSAWQLQVPGGDGWKTVCKGTTIGPMGVEFEFEPVTAERVRLLLTSSIGGPTIWDFALFPPRP